MHAPLPFRIDYSRDGDLLRAHVTGVNGTLETTLACWMSLAAELQRERPGALLVVDDMEGDPPPPEQLAQFVQAMVGMGFEGVRVATWKRTRNRSRKSSTARSSPANRASMRGCSATRSMRGSGCATACVEGRQLSRAGRLRMSSGSKARISLTKPGSDSSEYPVCRAAILPSRSMMNMFGRTSTPYWSLMPPPESCT